MKKIILFGVGIVMSLSILSQTPEITWQKLLGGTDSDSGLDIQSTTDGGYIIAAASNSYDGDIQNPLGNYDFWIVKLDETGDIEWKNTYGGTDWEWPKAIKQTADGGFISIGFTYSNDGDITDFKGLRDGWIIKLDAGGDLKWQRTLGGTGPDSGEDVVILNDGYLVAGIDGGENNGDLQGMACTGEFWILKLDFDGNILWQQCYGGNGIDYPEKMISLSNGNYAIIGYTDSDDGDVTGKHGSYDYWVITIDKDGGLIWQKTLGGSSWDQAFGAVDTGDGLMVVGESLSEDGDITGHWGDTDFWVVKLDYNGDMEWQKSFGGSAEDKARAAIATGNGEYIISGVAGSADGDVSNNHGNGDYWAFQIDGDGNMQWNQTMGGSDYELIYSSVMSTNDNGILFVGHTNSNDGDIIDPLGDDDLWIVKLGGIPTATEDILNLPQALSIYPNPVDNHSSVFIENNLPDANWLRVFNLEGMMIFEQSIDHKSGLIEVLVANWTPGTYLVEINSPFNCQIGKIIVAKAN